MSVSPLTPLSLTAEVNINKLKSAFRDLEDKFGFYADCGTWCCGLCALNDVWEESDGKPFVFWHEQSEDLLHKYPNEPMKIYYGISKDNMSVKQITVIAKNIISVLEQFELPCQWDERNEIREILVSLDKHVPTRADSNGDKKGDYLDVALYLPKNEDTLDYCWDEGIEEDGEPADSYYFYQAIEDGESLKDAVIRVPVKIRKFITHYQRCLNTDDCVIELEPILSMDDGYGHQRSGQSLQELLNDSENPISAEQLISPDQPFVITFDLESFKELLERGVEMGSKYFFLIKSVGIYLYARSCDFNACINENVDDFVLAADGLDEDFCLSDDVEIGSEASELEGNRIYELSNQLYRGDVCEWFALRPEMVDDCDLMIDRGFDKIRFTFESLKFNIGALPSSSRASLIDGSEIMIHNISIRLNGGACPASDFVASIIIDYVDSTGRINPIKCTNNQGQSLHLSPQASKDFYFNK